MSFKYLLLSQMTKKEAHHSHLNWCIKFKIIKNDVLIAIADVALGMMNDSKHSSEHVINSMCSKWHSTSVCRRLECSEELFFHPQCN